MHRTSWTASIALLSTVLSQAPAAAQCQGTLQYSLVVPGLVDAENVSLSSIEDLDNDGARDLVIGIPDTSSSGRVEIWSTLAQVQLLSFAPPPTTPKTSFGWDVVNVYDADGDSLEDVLVGAPHDAPGSFVPSTVHGVAFVYSSVTGALLQTILPSAVSVTPSRFGWCVARGGPINANPGGEVLIGAPGFRGNRGLVDCVNIAGGSPSLVGTLHGAQAGEHFGFSVTAMRDGAQVNVAIGAPNPTQACGVTGAVHLFPGASFGEGTTTPSWSVTCVGGSNNIGFALAGIADLDGLGADELAVGAPSLTPGVGTAMVLDGATGSTVAAYTDVPHVGWSCAKIGDQDCDGKPDALFGGPPFGGAFSAPIHLSAGTGSWSAPLYPPIVAQFGVDVTGLGVVPSTGAGGFAIVDASVLGAPGTATIHVYY